MKKILYTSSFMIVTLLLLNACNKTRDNNCDFYVEKYIQNNLDKSKDSTFIYLNKVIKCFPNDVFYKLEKVKLFVSYNDLIKASNELNKMNYKGDLSLEFFYLVLDLKMEKERANLNLNKYYNKILSTPNDQKISFDETLYKLALDNFFKGKEFSLDELEKVRRSLNDDYSKSVLTFLESTIKNKRKEDVLFNLINIK